ncbi:hypothetical protein ERO13_D02G077700v2 [Gossypium hirsutum]|uniref:Uncharacterized protein LOC107910362 isoform X1 n=1 Tax=Gossypium hirsutum TaxID=3635 RepID=A0A1U8JY38_GOSHI|nr:uncharacterized protein LOC107910362 isoform X1 [Gossypium hirsutum]XP_016693669.1 uncharacterized protein LOC107910362 isoform X1 [Gossypium hirsutum]KAG4157674.1 hypothetical protein ERO13_D02G077700v2 [Gossypium hirsutum]KAG4157675.1 hypothetical protein ERO13_D02G077700v2 [Gossypium hirsutum]
MGKVKKVKCYNGGSEMLEDLRFDNLLAEARSESFRVRNIKEINKQFSEIDMEDIDSDYGMFWSSLIDYISVLAHKCDVQPSKKIKRDGKIDESLEKLLGSLDKFEKYPEFIFGTYHTNRHRKYDESCEQPSKEITCDSVVDESLKEFLGSLDKIPEFIHGTYNTNLNRKYYRSCSDLNILTLDDTCEGGYAPFVPSTSLAKEECKDAIRTPSQPQFREKVMALLRTPYDQKEFDNLWREVTYRKPKQGAGNICHRLIKNYSTKTKEKSLLDLHQEVRMKIDEYRSDRRKLLCLLRGFFFWLEKLPSYEDAFPPRLDTLYLNALG